LRDDGRLDPLRIVENLFDAGVDLVLGEGPELGGDLGVQRIPQPHQFLEVRDPHGTRRCRARGAEARGLAPIVAVQTPNIEHLFDHIPELSATFHRLLRGSRSAVPSICPPGDGYPGGERLVPPIARHGCGAGDPPAGRRRRGRVPGRVLLDGATAPVHPRREPTMSPTDRPATDTATGTDRAAPDPADRFADAPYSAELYSWSRSHGAYLGPDDPADVPGRGEAWRRIAGTAGAVLVAAGIACGLVYGLGYGPDAAPVPSAPGPVATAPMSFVSPTD